MGYFAITLGLICLVDGSVFPVGGGDLLDFTCIVENELCATVLVTSDQMDRLLRESSEFLRPRHCIRLLYRRQESRKFELSMSYRGFHDRVWSTFFIPA